MAKKLFYNYIFDASAKTIKIEGLYKLRTLQLITNVTDGIIIYNFADPNKGGSTNYNSITNETTLTLEHDTTSMSDDDELQIFIDEQHEQIEFTDTFIDPVNKLRVSNPENLIDTDFEYGLQPTKWETIELVDNIPSVYTRASGVSIAEISQVNTTINSDTISVVTLTEHDLSVGDPIEVQGTNSRTANGKYIVTSVINDFRFSYRASAIQPSTSNVKTAYTTIIPGSFFVGSDILFDESEGISTDEGNPSTLTVTTNSTHGLSTNTSVYITNTIGKKEFTVSNPTATASDGNQYIDSTNDNIFIENHQLEPEQTIIIYPNTTSNPSASLPSLQSGSVQPSGSTTVTNVYNSVNTAVSSIRSTMGNDRSDIYMNNTGTSASYVNGNYLFSPYSGSLQQFRQFIIYSEIAGQSLYFYNSTNQDMRYFANLSNISPTTLFTGQAIDYGAYWTKSYANYDSSSSPSSLTDKIWKIYTPFVHNSTTDALVAVTQIQDLSTISPNSVGYNLYENTYPNKRALLNDYRFGWNFLTGNTATNLGNGWNYTYCADYLWPRGSYNGFIKLYLNVWNTNWSGVYGTNSNWFYFNYNSQPAFQNRDNTNRGTNYIVEVLLQIKGDVSSNRYGGGGSVLTTAQMASIIANQIASDNTLGQWANGNTSSNTVRISSTSTNRISLKTETNQVLLFSDSGTGPIEIETLSTAGVLDNYFQISSTTSNTFEVDGKASIPNRTLNFTDAEINQDSSTSEYHIYIFNDHGIKTGQKVLFNVVSGTAPAGLTDATTYYAIVDGNKYLRLASSKTNAEGNVNAITGSGSGTFSLDIPSVNGRATSSGLVDTVEGSNIVSGTNTKFLANYKVGDTFTILTQDTGGIRSYLENTIKSVVSDTKLTLENSVGLTTTSQNHFVDTKINVRADGTFIHRPFDGGVEITAGKSPDSTIVRQTRKYFRYQSGKGIQCSMAINFNPFKPIRLIQGSGSNITATTEYPHGLTTGDVVKITGAEEKSSYTPSDALYNTSTGDLTITIDSHGFEAGEYITLAENSLTFTCDLDGNSSNHTYPRSSDPAGKGEKLLIKSVTTNTFVVNVGTSSYAGNHSFVSASANSVTHIDVSNAYNGSFTVTSATDFTFNYTSSTSVTQAIPTGFVEYAISDYTNAGIRAGLFDFQNGFFFEYNGKNLYAVRRSSVQQIPGTITAIHKSNILTGVNTRFQDNLDAGDMIVVRGQSYKVTNVVSQDTLHIQPYYRGTTDSGIVVTKTVDTRIPQNQWNIDKADGSGPSGYSLDINKIQMVYMDYSWYGAGKIRFGFKDTKGHVKYMHEFIHNNRLNEAYMRSGNIPARYEAFNTGEPTYTPSLFHWGTSVIMDGGFDDDDSYLFTAAGNTLTFTNGDSVTATTTASSSLVSQRVSGQLRDYYVAIPFSTADSSKFTVGIPLYTSGGELTGQTVSFTQISSGTLNVYIYIGRSYSQPAIYPSVGSATVVSIGAADSGSSTAVDLNTLIPLISIRLAPSVDNNLVGYLGQRDIINRMQLKLKELGVSVSHDTKITVILNGNLSKLDYDNVGTPSLSQYIAHDIGDTINGGVTIYSFRASGGSTDSTGKRLSVSSAFSLSGLSDLGNSILGGDDVFPNGPDIITICATVIDTTEVDSGSSYRVASRLSWAESQA